MAGENAEAPHGHIAALDGVRGIAILMVIVYHFFIIPQTRSTLTLDNVVFKVAEVGWAGVDLFFVLSGFLITGILLNARGGSGYFSSFYARRFLRIFPLYYIALAVILFGLPLIPWFDGQRPIQEARDGQFWFWTYLVNVRVAFLPLQSVGFATGHFWTLAVEEQFYLIWPAVVLLCGRRALIGVCVACIVIAPALRIVFATAGFEHVIATFAMSTLTPSRMDTFATGALIAIFARDPAAIRAFAARWLLPLAAAPLTALALLAIFSDDRGLPPQDYWVQTLGYTALALSFGALIVAGITASQRGVLRRALTQPVLTTFGRYSYALYVIHLPVAVFLAARYTEHNRWPLVAGSDIPGRLMFAFAGVSISLVLAWVSWNVLEQPLLRLKRHFPYGSRSEPVMDPGYVAAPVAVASGERS